MVRNWMLAAGAAALAMAVPAFADPKGGKGQGGDKGAAAKVERGGAKGNGGDRARSSEPGHPGHAMAAGQRGKPDKAERRVARSIEPAAPKGRGPKADRVVIAADGDRLIRRTFVEGGPFFRRGNQPFDCPPGLDRKDNGCLPPGQVTKLIGAPLAAAFADDLVPLAYRNWYRDDDDYLYRSGDGFIYRVDRSSGRVDGLIPLFGSGYYALGDPWPQPYDFYNVPHQYRSLWSDRDDAYYRFGDGAIYRVDPTTSAVQSIVALLAGDLGVGSRLPLGYDAYNVPLAYRDRYYDTADNWYRYNDGYIYRVDPTTRLITAVIDAII